jgi:hypothetical protein
VIGISLALSVALLPLAPALATYYFCSPAMTDVLRVFSLQIPVLVLFRFLAGAAIAAKRFDFASKITNIISPAMAGRLNASLQPQEEACTPWMASRYLTANLAKEPSDHDHRRRRFTWQPLMARARDWIR